MNPERAYYTDLGEYTFMEDQVASYKRPQIEPDIIGFIKPYTPEVWLCVLAVLVTMTTVNFFIQRGSLYIKGLTRQSETAFTVKTDENKLNPLKTFLNSGMQTFSSLIGSPIPGVTPSQSLKFLSGMWLLMSFILASVYRSNLMAMLILPKVTLPFNSLEELVASKLPVWVPNGSAMHRASL
ncbi:hypothetical protein SK128_027615, partial [Halocaridina rubra]